jgi:hypothetical protein
MERGTREARMQFAQVCQFNIAAFGIETCRVAKNNQMCSSACKALACPQLPFDLQRLNMPHRAHAHVVATRTTPRRLHITRCTTTTTAASHLAQRARERLNVPASVPQRRRRRLARQACKRAHALAAAAAVARRLLRHAALQLQAVLMKAAVAAAQQREAAADGTIAARVRH